MPESGSDRARLDQEDEGRPAQPGEQGELGRRRCADERDHHQVDDESDDQGGGRLEQAEQDLEDQVGHAGQTARRPWSARIRVTSSAYSRSPPTGRPRAIRLTPSTKVSHLAGADTVGAYIY